MIDSAGDGEIVNVVTQFAIFEVSYVLRSFYGMDVGEVATLVRDMIALPGVQVVDDCPWKKVLEYWPARLPGLADAATVTVALTNRCAKATFDQKMVKRMRSLNVQSYW